MSKRAERESLDVGVCCQNLLHFQVGVDAVVQLHENGAGLPQPEAQRCHEIGVSLVRMKALPGEHLHRGVRGDEDDVVEEGACGSEPVPRNDRRAVEATSVARYRIPRRDRGSENRSVIGERLGDAGGQPAFEHEVVLRVYRDNVIEAGHPRVSPREAEHREKSLGSDRLHALDAADGTHCFRGEVAPAGCVEEGVEGLRGDVGALR